MNSQHVFENDKAQVAFVLDAFQVIGPVRAKAMFGGYGVYIEECMVGLIADQELYLKVDEALAMDYAKLGLAHFTYLKTGKRVKLSYCQAPADIYDDLATLAFWVRQSYEVASRAKFTRCSRRKGK